MPRPSQPLATRESVADAALLLIDELGISGVSTRKIAAKLGVTSAALYHHFKSKEEMYDLVVRRAFRAVREVDRTTHWTTQLGELARECFHALAAHPNLGPIVLNTRYHEFNNAFLGANVRSMALDGVPLRLIPSIIDSFAVYTYGAATAGYGNSFQQNRPAELEDFPTVMEGFADFDAAAAFEEGLTALTAGWLVRLRSAESSKN